MTALSSMSAITRMGLLHLGHSSGSTSYTLWMRRAQVERTRAASRASISRVMTSAAHGFLRVRCADCAHEKRVAFS